MESTTKLDIAVISLLVSLPHSVRELIFNKHVIQYKNQMSKWIFDELEKEF